jgi:hypothetical protein
MDLPEHVSKIHPERDAEASAVEEGVLDSAQMSSRIGQAGWCLPAACLA